MLKKLAINYKRILSGALLIFLFGNSVYAQPEQIKKFFECGFPSLNDYRCFAYDMIKISKNAKELQLSVNYNGFVINKHLRNQMRIMRTASFLVVKNNKIIYENYWLKFEKDSVMNSFSVAKTIVALLVGIAIDQGKIQSINQKVSDFLPWFNQYYDSLVTIKDVLTMSSGINWSEEFLNPQSDIVKAYYGNHIKDLIYNTHSTNPPGQKWNYQCGNTLLLSLILEKATGMKISDFAEKYLWQPIGATNEAYWGKYRNDSITKAFCCFYATARDFAKLGLLVLNKGIVNNKRIISEDYLKQMIVPADWLIYGKNRKVDFYALHIWLYKYKGKVYPYFSGMFGQYIIIIPEYNAVVVRTGEMVNELKITPVPPDLKLYMKVAMKILKSKNS